MSNSALKIIITLFQVLMFFILCGKFWHLIGKYYNIFNRNFLNTSPFNYPLIVPDSPYKCIVKSPTSSKYIWDSWVRSVDRSKTGPRKGSNPSLTVPKPITNKSKFGDYDAIRHISFHISFHFIRQMKWKECIVISYIFLKN